MPPLPEKVRRLQRKLYDVKGVGYSIETLVSLATLPRKWRAQEKRFEQLERALTAAPPPPDPSGLVQHVPAILNYITSFAHTSRELMRSITELRENVRTLQASMQQGTARSEAKLAELWHRTEFVRAETMYELMHGAKRAPAPAAEPRIVNAEKVKAMDGSLRLNLGCGHIAIPEYVNVDMRELPGVDVVADLHKLPFDDGQVSELFSAHVLEHFPQEELRRVLLPYWARLVKPGGVFRAVVPDWESMIQSYVQGNTPFDDLREVTFGGQEYEGDFHFTMFSKATLKQLLEHAGLRDVEFPVVGRPNGKCLELEVRAVK